MATDDSIDIDFYFARFREIYPEAFLNDPDLRTILINIENKEELEALNFFLGHTLMSHPDMRAAGKILFEHVDQSKYDLRNWIEAFPIFKKYLLENNKAINIKLIYGYILCSGDSPENKTLKYSLKHLVQKMLEDYGYIG